MQKYKIVATKSQKKYTIIVSAESDGEAKQKLHKDGYSILSIHPLQEGDIEGRKFIFQVEKDGEIKNGVIVGEDIFKVYMKLRADLEYNVISLYPQGDDAAQNAQKKQEIIHKLEIGYELQKNREKKKKEKISGEENFYLKKELDKTSALIEKVIHKFESFFAQRQKYNIDEETGEKLQKVYEKLIHIKGSTNIVKLREIGELALTKLAQVELMSVEQKKTQESRKLLDQTNVLLKEIGSHKKFIEHDKDIKAQLKEYFSSLFEGMWGISLKKNKKKEDNIIDTNSYNFLKTILLLEKYQQKLSENSAEIRKNLILFLNPFKQSEFKEKTLLKRKVITQNISLLKAKKSGGISSYTSIKKGYKKIIELFLDHIHFFARTCYVAIGVYVVSFFLSSSFQYFNISFFIFNSQALRGFLLFFLFFILCSISRRLYLFFPALVFFIFVFIVSMINF